jgi:hypothetical protein
MPQINKRPVDHADHPKQFLLDQVYLLDYLAIQYNELLLLCYQHQMCPTSSAFRSTASSATMCAIAIFEFRQSKKQKSASRIARFETTCLLGPAIEIFAVTAFFEALF